MANEYEQIIFVDKDGEEHTEGHIIGVWFEDHGENGKEKQADMLVEDFEKLDVLLSFPATIYGTWEYRNKKIIPSGSPTHKIP